MNTTQIAEPYIVNNSETLKIGISGTATAFSFKLKASMDGVNYTNIAFIKDDVLQIVTEATTGGLYTADITGYMYIKPELTTITGGNLTVNATMNQTA